jgi:hypothetical protein
MNDAKKTQTQALSRKFGLSEGVEIQSGMVVSYVDPANGRSGWYRVRKATKNTVNLGSIFGKTLYHKAVPKHLVYEDEAAWYKSWSQSETYMSM